MLLPVLILASAVLLDATATVEPGKIERMCIPGTDIAIEMVWVPPGSFTMGSPEGEEGRYDNEGPQHRVSVPGFWLGKYEVTRAQWQAVMGKSEPETAGNLPVEVTWNECQEFISRLNRLIPEGGFRLPGEAEWEYACRAGSTSRFWFGEDAAKLGEYAWYSGNADGESHPVGLKQPNPWGLHDMYGNAWEWCQDDYHRSYEDSPPEGQDKEDVGLRVLRGGSWATDAHRCRSAHRIGFYAGHRHYCSGFRLRRVHSAKPLPPE